MKLTKEQVSKIEDIITFEGDHTAKETAEKLGVPKHFIMPAMSFFTLIGIRPAKRASALRGIGFKTIRARRAEFAEFLAAKDAQAKNEAPQ